MRVLHVITGLDAGGAEQQLRLLCRHHGPDTHAEVAVLSAPGSVARAIRAEGTTVHQVEMGGNRDLRAVVRLARLMRRGRYDCVHTHLFRAGLHGRLAARLAGVRRVIATEHSLNEHVIEGRPTSRRGLASLYRAGEALGDVTIAVSGATSERMRAWRVPSRKIVVVPNGVDAEAMRFSSASRTRVRHGYGLPPGAFVVGTAARLVDLKRVDLLLDALARHPAVHGLVVGEGPAGPLLRQRCAELGLAERVVFTGESDEVPAMLSAMDLFVSTGPQETYGLAAVEALASGLPVLYVRCPALEERPPEEAPSATRVAGTVDDVAAAIGNARANHDGSVPPRSVPPVVAAYDIRRVVAAIEELYRIRSRSQARRPPAASVAGAPPPRAGSRPRAW